MEGGLDNIDCVKTPRIRMAKEAIEVLMQLLQEEHNYKTLVIDTIDWLEKAICKEIAEFYGKDTVEEIGYGKGYPLVVNRWGEFLDAFEALRVKKNMTILMLSHAEIKKFTPPIGDEYDMYSPKLYGKKDKTQTSLALILEYADIIMFANYKTITKEVGEGFSKRKQAIANIERVLYTDACNPAFIAGNRYGLKSEMPFSFEVFATDFAEKIKTTTPTMEKKNV